MRDEWCYFNKYLNEDFCNRVISELSPLATTNSSIGLIQNLNIDTKSRRSKIVFIHSNEEKYKYIFDVFWQTAIESNRNFFGFEISKLDYIQFSSYNSSDLGEYKAHRDVFWLNNDPFYHRKLSGMVQLSDPNDYEGGDFEITDHVKEKPTPEDIRNRGSVVYIPSFIEHKVNPVTKGIRYSLVAWFDGPKWR